MLEASTDSGPPDIRLGILTHPVGKAITHRYLSRVADENEASGDTDSDGSPDTHDRDDDGDGIDTQTEVEDGELYGSDPDGDGIPNWIDVNSDGDVFTDLQEGDGYRAGNPTPVYLDPLYPCGDGSSDTQPGSTHENCEICPVDCCP